MSINIGTLDIGVAFAGDTAGLQKATADARQGIDRFGASTSKAMRQVREDTIGAEDALGRLQKGFDSVGQGAAGIGRSFAGMAGGLAGVFSAGEFIKAADAVTTLDNKLKLATGSTQAAGQAYEALFDIAQRSRVSFTELGGTFAAVSRAGQELGISQVRLLSVTESIGNAMTISGGNAESMKAALVQLGQGLASGTLRGEELNSVMEQTPRLAKALADGLGVPIGKLREMGAAGQITAQQVILALESQSSVLRGEVAGAVMTVGQAFTQLQNASVKTVGEFDKASGASKALADAISGLSTSVSGVGKAFADNEAAIKTTIGVLAGAGVAAAMARTATAMAGVATGVGGVAGAITVLKGVVAGLNPITLGLLGLGAVVGGVSAYNSAHANDIDRMTTRLRELEEIQSRGGKTIYGGESTAAQVKERVDEIDRLRAAISAANEEKAKGNMIPSGGSAERELAAANRKAAESYDDLRIRLSGFKGDYAKYQTDLRQIQSGMASGAIGQQEGVAMLTELAKKHGDVAKAAHARKPYEDALAESANSYGDAMKKLAGNSIDAESAANGYTKTQKTMLEIFSSSGFAGMPDVWKQTIVAEAEAKIAAEQLAGANKALALSGVEAAKVEQTRIDAAERGAASVLGKLQALQDEEKALVIAAAQNISLAQAIEEVEIARLREQQTALMREGDRDSEVLAIQQEIDARKKLKAAIGVKEGREAAADEAKAAADAWQKASEQIEKDITDALMRGFESGKGFAEVLRDTVANMFKTLVLRPVVSAIVNPVAGAITGGLGLAGAANAATGAGNLMGAGAGLYNSFATSSVGGSLGLSVPYVDVLGTGAAEAGIMTSAGSSLGAALPWIGGGLAVLSLLKSLDDSGTYHTGGLGSYSAAGGTAVGDAVKTQGLGFDLAAKDYTASSQQAAAALAQSVVGMLDSTANTFGAQAGYYAATAFADDTSKDGAWGALMLKLGDKVLIDWQQGTDKWPGREFSDGEAGAKEYAAAIAVAVRDQLITQVPDWADAALQALGDAPTLDQLGAVVTQINAAAAAMAGMGQASAAFAGLSETATAALIKALGGAEASSSSLGSYYTNFYSEAERTAIATAQLTDQLATLGVAMPTGRDAYRALVDAAVAAGDATLAAKLIGLGDAFSALVPAADAATAAAEAAAAVSTSTLKTAIDREKTLWQTQADAAAQLRDEVQGVFATLSDGITALRADGLGVQGAAAQAQQYISQALAAALGTGALPDGTALADAISTAQAGISGGQYGSETDRQYAALVLAGQLETLQGVAGDQLTEAERQYRAAQTQIEQLDKTLAYWEQQVDLSQGNIDATLSVADAIATLQEAIKPGSTKKAAADVKDAAVRQYAYSPTSGSGYTTDTYSMTATSEQIVGGLAAQAAGIRTAYEQAIIWTNGSQDRLLGSIDAVTAAAIAAGATATQAAAGATAAAAWADYVASTGNVPSSAADFNAYVSSLPKLAVGTNYIPQDGPYYLHAGESVQPVAYNPAVGGGMGNTARLETLVQGLTTEVQRLQAVVAEGNGHAKSTAETLVRVAPGDALVTQTAPTFA